MHRTLLLTLTLISALRFDVLSAQTHAGITVEVASDGTCDAIGLHSACRAIGAKLREAGIPPETWITFHGDATLKYELMEETIDSLARAGFKNLKTGFLTEPAH